MKVSKLNLLLGTALVLCSLGALLTAPSARAVLLMIASALTVSGYQIYARERKTPAPARTRRRQPVVVRRRPRNW
jgi:hypothetical protein